jgi:hypothetical protein
MAMRIEGLWLRRSEWGGEIEGKGKGRGYAERRKA